MFSFHGDHTHEWFLGVAHGLIVDDVLVDKDLINFIEVCKTLSLTIQVGEVTYPILNSVTVGLKSLMFGEIVVRRKNCNFSVCACEVYLAREWIDCVSELDWRSWEIFFELCQDEVEHIRN